MKPTKSIFIALTLVLALAVFVSAFSTAQAAPLPQVNIQAGQMLTTLPLASGADFQGWNSALTAGKTYACKLLSQSPKDWTKFKPRHIFDAKWTVQNTGTAGWKTSGTDLIYVGGSKMHTHADVFDIAKAVAPQGKISFIVDMVTPKTRGYYTEYWGLSNNGGSTFCKFYITVTVK